MKSDLTNFFALFDDMSAIFFEPDSYELSLIGFGFFNFKHQQHWNGICFCSRRRSHLELEQANYYFLVTVYLIPVWQLVH